MWMFKDLAGGMFAKYVAWISLPIVLILFAAGWVQMIGPQSIGKFHTLCILL